jgi:tetratricopeptide (TPR) repeat protein
MDYDAVLAQVLELLQREQRLSYRILKRRFALDDNDLEDLKEDLIYAKKLAVDEDGRVLVWTGAPVPLPATSDISPAQVGASPAIPHTPDAERRQQTACTEVIQRYDGHVAQLLGDGLLVYFGYPQAHEDDPQRAVRTGLGILAAMRNLNTRLQQAKGIQLALRIGIHTGLVVVGAMGGGARHEQLALGETPNVAARIQGLAAPNTMAISEATRRLVQGYFDCEALGVQTLRGVAELITVYQILRESGVTSRLDVAQPRGLTPLVGRESEVRLLLERWEQVKAGYGQVVLLSGEAGIGKSRLVRVLQEQEDGTAATRIECRCSSYHQNSPLYPIITHLQRVLGFDQHATPEAKLDTLEQELAPHALPLAEVVPLLAALLMLPLPTRYPPLTLTPQRQKQKTLEVLLLWLLQEAERRPVLFVVEDLHWSDPSTLEFLTLLIDQGPTAPLLTLLTCRPAFHAPWGFRAHLTPLTLSRLPRPQATQMTVRVTGGKALPLEVVEQIVTKTDGVPLFVEELTKMVLESGLLRAGEACYELTGPLPPLAIPATLHDSLMARLDHLATVKDVAQLGATIGRTFAYELLQAVSPLDEAMLQHSLRQLVNAELVYQRGVPPQAAYTFKHALIQDAAYQSLLRSTRQQYHQRIAQVLEARFPEICETQPELLAHHYMEAGLSEQAVVYWHKAGQRAVEHSAHVEAIRHLTKGVEVLQTLPDTPERTQQELTLQVTLGVPLQATKGYTAPEVEQTYTRAQELCHQVGDTPQLLPVLHGLYRFYLVRAEHETAYEFGRQCLRLAQNLQESSLLLEAYRPLGLTSFYLGQLTASRWYLEHAIALYDPQQHRSHAFLYTTDPGATCLSFSALTLWHLGYPDQALQQSREAVRLAQELAHPLSQALVLAYAACFHQCRREVEIVCERAEAAIGLSTDVGIAQRLAQGAILRGWALVMQGQGEAGIAQISQGQALWRTVGGGWPSRGF